MTKEIIFKQLVEQLSHEINEWLKNVPQEHRNLVSGIVFSKEDKNF
jgi:predicted transposase YdaD